MLRKILFFICLFAFLLGLKTCGSGSTDRGNPAPGSSDENQNETDPPVPKEPPAEWDGLSDQIDIGLQIEDL